MMWFIAALADLNPSSSIPLAQKQLNESNRINRKCPMDGCRMYVDRRVSSHLIVRIEITEAVVLVCSGEVLCHDLGAFFFGCHLGVAYALLVGSIPIPLSGFCTLGSGELSLASCGETVFVLRSMLSRRESVGSINRKKIEKVLNAALRQRHDDDRRQRQTTRNPAETR